MSQKDLLEKIQKLHPDVSEGAINKQHLNNSINRDLNGLWARWIEQGLDIEEGTLDRWINKGTIIK